MAESYYRSWRVWRSRLMATGLASATESYAASVLYTTLASLSGAVWRIRWASARTTNGEQINAPRSISRTAVALRLASSPAVIVVNNASVLA
jgi:hypothetical protein